MRSLPLLSMCFLFWSAQAFAAEPLVEMKTSAGAIRIELYPDKAPKTVSNFLQYIKDGAYNGTQFHRVINGFMIQGGGFDRQFRETKTRAPIENEAGNGLRNDSGTIAMARTSDPQSATVQFFINVANNEALNFREPTRAGYGYAVFGKVVCGMDAVMRIARTPTGPGGPFASDVPLHPVVIESVSLISNK